ncbi:MAG: hypothetical protein QW607_04485 [Desulfurococcaceae archaeon]
MKYLVTDKDFFTVFKKLGLILLKIEALTETRFCHEVSDANLVNLIDNYEFNEFINKLCRTSIDKPPYLYHIGENDDIIVVKVLTKIPYNALTEEDLIELNKEKLIEYYKIEYRQLW